ncbi:MAG: class I SAM-dependent methyltransferase [Nostoc sp. JL34]|uniref:class I SAM-dependent methyltransferase n=2 Tax=unclassified Nostoc TaxID=2593658 RepID=UPI001DDA9F07|nr:class I SAM-dependent methyltransferase [Nostoc sp. JL34]MBN3881467.1 class I SAM-dependent methyltransferase [Nostoc sp. JL34]
MSETLTFDPIWEEKYSQGHSQRYPWDAVVSFVFRHYPHHKPRHEVRILEVGCGTGSNLWFAAREGFCVSGIDASHSAVKYAQKRFAEDNLTGDFRTGTFNQLPFENNYFDLVIDRGAITCCGLSVAQQTVAEIRRVLQTGGKFFFNPYSDRHSSYVSGRPGSDGLTLDISAGTLVGVGQICLYGRREVESLLTDAWKLLSLQHLEIVEQIQPQYMLHAEWRAISEKVY